MRTQIVAEDRDRQTFRDFQDMITVLCDTYGGNLSCDQCPFSKVCCHTDDSDKMLDSLIRKMAVLAEASKE